ncbi:hypothetical protein AVEN_264521-1 [Araneus ventricosus]|uniref:Uncharacterized protein n=1 Tax=Araneus ventricosus TaxID=182803 RepID=A0A4Y2G7L2_ARAVE|nr:hypothetical protein AVEN_264521-1 [Araneus ventricosus]
MGYYKGRVHVCPVPTTSTSVQITWYTKCSLEEESEESSGRKDLSLGISSRQEIGLKSMWLVISVQFGKRFFGKSSCAEALEIDWRSRFLLQTQQPIPDHVWTISN